MSLVNTSLVTWFLLLIDGMCWTHPQKIMEVINVEKPTILPVLLCIRGFPLEESPMNTVCVKKPSWILHPQKVPGPHLNMDKNPTSARNVGELSLVLTHPLGHTSESTLKRNLMHAKSVEKPLYTFQNLEST